MSISDRIEIIREAFSERSPNEGSILEKYKAPNGGQEYLDSCHKEGCIENDIFQDFNNWNQFDSWNNWGNR